MLRRVEVFDGNTRRVVDVRISDGRIAQFGSDLAAAGADIVDGRGGALLPGLHDHHLHLLAWAAARASVSCGPPALRTRAELGAALARAQPRAGWLRGIGYHESVAGDLDRARLDELRADVPVRVQHRSGALWVVNGRAADALGLADAAEPGIERDVHGVPTGRLWRLDGWLAARLPNQTPDLDAVWADLAASGITGVTDATPNLAADTVRALRASATGHARLVLLGDPDAPADVPRKIVIADHELPALDELSQQMADSRPRPVAVHCVTRAALVLCVAALRAVGARPGDRIEHAAVVPSELLPALRELGVTVVTQPSFVALRGDDYLREVDPDDRAVLWPYASLLGAGVPVGLSSDAPYGAADPWWTIAAAAARRAPSGRAVAPGERVPTATALRGYLSAAQAPGGPPRTVALGSPADLVLLDAPLAEVLTTPAREHVRLTTVGGRFTFRREDG